MTKRTALVQRLRDLAIHRCKMLGHSKESMEEWKAADEIEKLEAELKASQMGSHILGDRYNVLKEARRK